MMLTELCNCISGYILSFFSSTVNLSSVVNKETNNQLSISQTTHGTLFIKNNSVKTYNINTNNNTSSIYNNNAINYNCKDINDNECDIERICNVKSDKENNGHNSYGFNSKIRYNNHRNSLKSVVELFRRDVLLILLWGNDTDVLVVVGYWSLCDIIIAQGRPRRWGLSHTPRLGQGGGPRKRRARSYPLR